MSNAPTRIAQALLRACPGIPPATLAQQERIFVAAFDPPGPEPFDLGPLHQALLEAGVDMESANALALLIEVRAADLGREIVLPAAARELAPAARRELVQTIEPAFERQLALQPPAVSVLNFDHTPAVDVRGMILATSTRKSATLLVLRGRSLGRLYKLEGPRFLLGRASSADIILDDDGVSRFHAVITREGEELRVEDLGSKNGVIVNGFKVTEHPLEEGDRIQLGTSTVLKFSHTDDIEEQFQEELYRSVIVDPLTGVYNRRHLVDRLRSECAYARRQGTVVSLLMIDIDLFKKVNDLHGHLVGDAVLRGTAMAIQHSLRTEDVFGRYGGEEFTVILRGLDAPHALAAGNRIVEIVRSNTVRDQELELKVTVSVGVATSVPEKLDTPQELIDAADRALYRAKSRGRDCCEGGGEV